MNSKPLQYESVKVVLLHLNPNVRIQIAGRLPAIRLTEKLVPLRIHELQFGRFHTIISNTTYRLGVYRKYPPLEKVPNREQTENEEGGAQYDIDRYGFGSYPGNTFFGPGDVSFLFDKFSDLRIVTDKDEVSYQNEMKKNEDELAQKWKISPYARKESDIDCIKALQSIIDHYREELLPFHRRRLNLPTPYVCELQVTIITGKIVKQIHRFPYTMKLPEAVKKLNNFLFGGRRVAIQVPRFGVPSRNPTLHLPVGFKIKTKYIDNVAFLSLFYDSLMSILDDSCFPLNAVSMYPHVDIEHNRRFPKIENARKLVITEVDGDSKLQEILKNISSQHVLLSDYKTDYQAKDYFDLIQNWLKNDFPRGRCYSFVVKKEEIATRLLNLISEQLENTTKSERCISIPAWNSVRLEVSYGQSIGPCNEENRRYIDVKNWAWVLDIQIFRD
ncbi:hypothetical protein CRE_26338 [Caenorhabditis remanei]|uniref:Uncharacterized protein n=1 Tax=Caenorhabditis remanei TaxID=31234 RepID=E3LRI0_CAERE|nr:hypothetical protein CRE_26338 [Caenorhabditis remanei]